mmetsp:Transcript_10414/g.32833  ORF Transcript_10414/g.32833 Transcript_10414/m.32833 type:complete len:267 (-) Transcript_10414:88-888(-)
MGSARTARFIPRCPPDGRPASMHTSGSWQPVGWDSEATTFRLQFSRDWPAFDRRSCARPRGRAPRVALVRRDACRVGRQVGRNRLPRLLLLDLRRVDGLARKGCEGYALAHLCTARRHDELGLQLVAGRIDRRRAQNHAVRRDARERPRRQIAHDDNARAAHRFERHVVRQPRQDCARLGLAHVDRLDVKLFALRMRLGLEDVADAEVKPRDVDGPIGRGSGWRRGRLGRLGLLGRFRLLRRLWRGRRLGPHCCGRGLGAWGGRRG